MSYDHKKYIFFLMKIRSISSIKKVTGMKNEENRRNSIKTGIMNETKEPSLYRVLVHSDDFTPIGFIVGILESIFYMDRRQATDTMLKAHTEGKAACGTYSKDCAEAKMSQVMEYAQKYQYPLMSSMEVV